jgi:hypothetical protein
LNYNIKFELLVHQLLWEVLYNIIQQIPVQKKPRINLTLTIKNIIHDDFMIVL